MVARIVVASLGLAMLAAAIPIEVWARWLDHSPKE